MTTLNVSPTENGTLAITPTYTDENDVVIPYGQLQSPVWTLYRKNTQEVLFTDSITSSTIILTCSELAIIDAADDGVRVFGIDATYDSTNGNGLCLTDEVEFTITDLVSQT